MSAEAPRLSNASDRPPAAALDPAAMTRLEPLEQAVLAALALGAVPRPRTWVFEVLAESTLRPHFGRRPTQQQVRGALESLAQAGWVDQDLRRTGYWQLNATAQSAAWVHTLDLAPVEVLRDVLARADGYSLLNLHRFASPRMPTVEAAVARLRLEVVTGAAPEDLQSLTSRLPWGCQDPEDLMAAVLLPLASDVCLPDLHPGFQARALLDGLQMLNGAWRMPEGYHLLAHCRRLLDSPELAETGPLGASLRGTFLEALLARGEFDEVQARLAPSLATLEAASPVPTVSGSAQLLSCCLQAQAGQWEAAESSFEQGLAGLRKTTGRRNGLVGTQAGTFYVLSLLACQQPAAWQKALKLCLAEGGSREPMLDRPWGLMALAIQMRLGEVPRDPAVFQPYVLGGQVQASPLDLWRWLARAWLKEGSVPEPLSATELEAARKLQQRLSDAGLAGWGRQLDAALSVLAGERAPQWFFVRSARERWQVALDALQVVAQPVSVASAAGSNGAAAETRLLWQLELNSQGAILGLEPLEQKRGARGWGRPKAVPLSRLQKAVSTLPPPDQGIARHIVQDGYSRNLRLKLTDAVPALVGHPQVCFEDRPDQPVELTEAGPELDVVREGPRVRVRIVPTLHVSGDEAQARWGTSAAEQKELDALRLYTIVRDTPQRARLIRLTPAQKRVAQLLGSAGLDIPEEGLSQLQEVLTGLGAHFRIHSDDGASAQASRDVAPDARLRAELSPQGQGLQVRLVAAPFGPDHAADGPRLAPGAGRARLVVALKGETLGVQRDLAGETTALGQVLDACTVLLPPPPGAPCEWLLDDPEEALAVVERLHTLPVLQAVDWPQGKSLRVDRGGLSQLSVQVHTRQEWLAVQGELQVDEQLVLSLQQLVAMAAGRNSRFVPLGEGRYLALTQELRERLDDLTAVAETSTGTLAELRVPAVAAPWLQQVTQGAQARFDEGFARRLTQLDEAQRVVPALPGGLQASLRPYQEEGFEWAMRLSHAGLGACLADDMGLGKTLQALAVLLARASKGAALVVAPTSLMGNWRAEARRFAPGLTVRVHAEAGSERTRLLAADGPGAVVLVSYPMLQIDAEAFAARSWATLVLDEAQAIKNAAAKRSQAVFDLQADFRLALSGTPIENRLSELWSIMRACNPGLLGSIASFNERFAGPIERQRDKRAQRQLRRLVAPFVLRRTKAEVLDDLPPRTELVLKVESDPAEQAHYEALRRDALVAAERSLSGDAPGQAHLNILAGLTRLRRAACDPRLVSPHLGDAGAKVRAFGELAAELVANGHKALVFSQFVDFLALLKEPLDAAGIAYQYLDGSTPSAERTRRVDAFQAGQGELFLISLKAGGFGLNLTVADYVVIADPWWNPAVEDQASGRAHRMGQQRPVTVYRLVNQGTLEEKILTLHRDKRELADLLLEGTESAQLPRADELLALMRGGEAATEGEADGP